MLFPAVRLARIVPALHCPVRVSFAGYVLPSGPSPCSGLSPPLSSMPDKTPHRLIEACRVSNTSPTRVLVPLFLMNSVSYFFLNTIHPVTNFLEPLGLPEFCGVSLLACHGLMTTADLLILAIADDSVLPSVHIKTLGVRNCNFEAVPALQGARSPLRPARFSEYAHRKCPWGALNPSCSLHSYNSAMDPRLDTGG